MDEDKVDLYLTDQGAYFAAIPNAKGVLVSRDRTVVVEAERKLNAFEPMRSAIEGALEWYGRPDESPLTRFERHADQFYLEHGMLAPGKSEPMEMGTSIEREEQRRKLWREWCAKRTSEVDGALAAALRAANGED